MYFYQSLQIAGWSTTLAFAKVAVQETQATRWNSKCSPRFSTCPEQTERKAAVHRFHRKTWTAKQIERTTKTKDKPAKWCKSPRSEAWAAKPTAAATAHRCTASQRNHRPISVVAFKRWKWPTQGPHSAVRNPTTQAKRRPIRPSGVSSKVATSSLVCIFRRCNRFVSRWNERVVEKSHVVIGLTLVLKQKQSYLNIQNWFRKAADLETIQ